MEKTHRGVESGTTPALETEKFITVLGNGVGYFELVDATHTSSQQGLMRITHCGVGDEEAFLLTHPFGKFFGAVLGQIVLSTCRLFSLRIEIGGDHGQVHNRHGASFDLLVAVDDGLTEEF